MASAVGEKLVDSNEEKTATNNPSQNTIVVFGGNGFVGLRICQLAINNSYQVIAVSRSGCPSFTKQIKEWDFVSKVIWYKADALNLTDKDKTYISSFNPLAIS